MRRVGRCSGGGHRGRHRCVGGGCGGHDGVACAEPGGGGVACGGGPPWSWWSLGGLSDAPVIPAGIRSFLRNPVESSGIKFG